MRYRTKKQKKELAAEVVRRLRGVYPTALCALDWQGDPWRLLVMGRLSAQCTDARVNAVCETLFRRYPDAASLAAAEPEEVEAVIRPCGLHHSKARDLIAASDRLVNVCGGRLPDTVEELLLFPGVGRKIANLLVGDVYGKPAVVADTHCIRIAGRLGFYPADKRDPRLTERVLSEAVEPAEQAGLCHRFVQFGRDTCTARSPSCSSCPLSDLCEEYEENEETGVR